MRKERLLFIPIINFKKWKKSASGFLSLMKESFFLTALSKNSSKCIETLMSSILSALEKISTRFFTICRNSISSLIILFLRARDKHTAFVYTLLLTPNNFLSALHKHCDNTKYLLIK